LPVTLREHFVVVVELVHRQTLYGPAFVVSGKDHESNAVFAFPLQRKVERVFQETCGGSQPYTVTLGHGFFRDPEYVSHVVPLPVGLKDQQ
jgi:hypothetical protein